MKIPTKFVTSLSEGQIKELEEIVANHPSFRIRRRAHSILLSAGQYCIEDICKILKVHRHSVYAWIEAWESSGIKGLEDKPQAGGKPKLTEFERKIAVELIKEHPRSLKTVLAKLAEITGKIISLSSLKRIAKAANLCWKRVKKSLKDKQDPKKIEEAQEEIEELKKQEKAGEIDLWYFDETGFCLVPSVPYAWQPIGENIELPTSRSKRLNLLGFMNTNNQLHSFF